MAGVFNFNNLYEKKTILSPMSYLFNMPIL